MPNSPTPSPPLVDAAQATPSLRTLGGGHLQAAAGDDSRFTTPSIATATPTPNAIPIALGTGKLAAGWLDIIGAGGFTGSIGLNQVAVGSGTSTIGGSAALTFLSGELVVTGPTASTVNIRASSAGTNDANSIQVANGTSSGLFFVAATGPNSFTANSSVGDIGIVSNNRLKKLIFGYNTSSGTTDAQFVISNSTISLVASNTTIASITTSGVLTLGTGSGSPLVSINGTGSSAPTFTTLSAGTRIIIQNPGIDASHATYGIGVEPGHMWFGTDIATDDAGHGFKWYAGTTQIARLSNGGTFNALTGLQVNGTAVVLQTRTLTGGSGINTIGDLSADRTISIDTSNAFNPTWNGVHIFNFGSNNVPITIDGNSATVGTPLRNSGNLALRGGYFVGSASKYDVWLRHNVTSASPVISKLSFLFGGTVTAGTGGGIGAILVDGTEVAFITNAGNMTLAGTTLNLDTLDIKPKASTPTQSQALAWDTTANAYIPQTLTGSGGTVTSVALALPGIFTVSGSPVTTTGTLTGTLATQSANTIWAGPATGAATAPTFRSLVTADFPVSGVTAATYGSASAVSVVTFDVTGRATSATTTTIAIADSQITYASHAANLVFATPNGSSGSPTYRALVGADLPASGVTATTYGSASAVGVFTVDATGRLTSATTTTIAITDSQITYASETANKVFASPNGSSGSPTYRALVAADLPNTTVTATSYGSASAVATFTVDVQGRLTTAATTTIAIADSQITYASQTANKFFASPSGGSGAPTYRTIVTADFPTSGVTATTYGDATHIPVVTFDATGRATSASTSATAVPKVAVTASDTQLTTTGATTIVTFTPAGAGNYIVYVYYRVVTGSTNVTISITYTDGTGSQTYAAVPITSTVIGSYNLVPIYINSTAAAITVTATAGTANQVFVSSSIIGV